MNPSKQGQTPQNRTYSVALKRASEKLPSVHAHNAANENRQKSNEDTLSMSF